MDSRFIPASLPEGTKRITAEQAEFLRNQRIEITIHWYRGHELQWGTMYGVIVPDEVQRIADGGYICINQQDYWQHFGYDVVFPALDAAKDNDLEFFGNKLTVRFDPDTWGEGGEYPSQEWMVMLPLGNNSNRGLFCEFSTDNENTKAFVINYYTELAAKAMPDFKFNFQFQS